MARARAVRMVGDTWLAGRSSATPTRSEKGIGNKSLTARQRIAGKVRWIPLVSSLGLSLMLCLPVAAQPVEQYPAPILSGERISSLPGQVLPKGEVDDTPFGVDLTGVVIVSDRDHLKPLANAHGVVVESDRSVLNDPALKKALEPFIGKPFSRQVIAEIRDTITQYMRMRARPLVAVIAPPQEITDGTVQFLVIPYRLGDKRVERVDTAHRNTSDRDITEKITAQSGDEVDTGKLLEDVNWLIRNPFRSVGVVFEPGQAVDTTDLILRLTDKKPWRVFAGMSNSGTEETYKSRVFTGFTAANSLAFDQRLAYQLTAAPKTLYSDGEWFNFDGDKAYMAHSASYYLPLDWRHILTFDASYVRTRSDLGPFFNKDSRSWQARADYAVPMPQLYAAPDLFAGFEVKRQKSELLFFGHSVSQSAIDIAQFVVGGRGEVMLPKSKTLYDIDVFFSPGGLSSDNTDAAFAAITGDPEASAQYVYVNAVLEHYQHLPHDFGLNVKASGQLSDAALPETEKFGIGGISSVRGYETNELSGDNGFFVQTELRTPVHEAPYLPLSFSPFVFFDVGQVGSWRDATGQTIASTGAGVDIDIAGNLHVSLDAAYALSNGIDTGAGDTWVHFNLTASY